MGSAQNTWLFRVASRADQGGGHVSRSLVLAKAWQDKVVFCLDEDSPYIAMVRGAGFDVIEVGQESDRYDGIFLDVYSGENFQNYRTRTDCLMILEGFKDFYDGADIYLRPYPGDFKTQPQNCLEGFSYALIDEKYKNQRTSNDEIKTITVSMGRYDSKNTTQFMLDVLSKRSENFHTNIVLGSKAVHLEDIKTYLENNYGRSYSLHIDLPDLVEIYSQSDILMSSGGVTSLEACAMGVPCLVMSFVEDQISLSEGLSEKNAIDYVGHFDDVSSSDINDALDRLLNEQNRRQLRGNMAFIDTDGPQRIYRAVTQFLSKREAA